MEEYIQITTTTEKKDDAEKIAQALLEKRLAGCVQVAGPIFSIYWWKGRIEKATEWQCIIKSRKDLYRKVEKVIKENHSYEVPEIMAISVVAGSKDYLKWLHEELVKT
jgi:periplasmic divalent cation tolerance protein